MNINISPLMTQPVTPTNRDLSLPNKSRNLQKMRESTREFEAIYINEMLKAMRKNVPDDGLFPKSQATTMYQEIIDMELARTMAAGEGIGLGEKMFQQLQKTVK